MQYRVIRRRFALPLTLLACLPLTLLTTPTVAQAPATGSSVPQTSPQDEAPQILIVTRRDPKISGHDDAIRIAMQDEIIALMRNSGHYQITLYTPTNQLIKRALTDHRISSLDLAEPLQPEGMQHVALALGIRTMLFLTPTFDKTSLKLESQLYQNVGQDTWQLGLAADADTPFQYGKQRLNNKQIVAVAVDGLAGSLGLPSHLAADLNVKTMDAAKAQQQATQKPVKPGKTDQVRADPPTKTDPPTRAVQGAPPDTQAIPNKTQAATSTPTTPPTITPRIEQPTVPTTPKNPVVKADKPKPEKNPGKNSAEAVKTPRNTGPADTMAPVDNRVGRSDIPTVQVIAHPNYETLADRYHDNHDMANTITHLRYAVNERPRDVPLRHKLILAYQENKMPDAALAEIARALQLAPNDSGLYRSYGDTLMNRGDVPNAEKAFREAIRLNANDIQARISLGDALMIDNQYPDALDSYMTAQKADPRSPLPHRRLARVYLLRSSSAPAQYTASLEEIARAAELTPANDKTSYQEDYGTLMQIVESRLRELLQEIAGNTVALTQGKQSKNDALRALADMQVRADALSNYLDKAPWAQGQEYAHRHYQQAAANLLQSITLFRNYLPKNEDSLKQQMEDARTQAYQEIDTAHKRLMAVREAVLSTK